MYLSKSMYCKCVQCNKMLWLEKHKPEEISEIDNSSVLDNGTKVGELAKKLFGDYIDIEYSDDLNKMISDTKNAMKNKICNITEASFDYNGNFCSVDILRKNDDDYEIYEVKSSTGVSNIYLDDISYQYYVLTKCGLNVTKACIVHINNKYIRNGVLEINKLFNIVDETSVAKNKFNEIDEKIKDINKYMERKTEEEKDIDTYCFKPYECEFYNYCSRNIGNNTVFDISGMQLSTKFNIYHSGFYKFEDLINSDINSKYKEQIDYELNNKGDKVLKDKIKKFLDTLSYPLYFLDFETYQQSIPLYDGISPYEQIPFQYSLHYYECDGAKLKHKEFLSEPNIDPRRSLALRLVSDIPMNVCVLAYNMSFEKRVIKKLSTLYPDLSNHLMNIYDNMKDLMIPFKNREYYNRDMKGLYTIKYVLPALFPNDPSLNYHNLELVHNGSEASNTFSELGKYTKEEQTEIRKHMLEYCGLDTYAMVKIYNKLREKVL